MVDQRSGLNLFGSQMLRLLHDQIPTDFLAGGVDNFLKRSARSGLVARVEARSAT